MRLPTFGRRLPPHAAFPAPRRRPGERSGAQLRPPTAAFRSPPARTEVALPGGGVASKFSLLPIPRMSDSITDEAASLIDELNALLRIGHDAEEAYAVAVGAVAAAGHRRVLRRSGRDHRHRVAELSGLIRRLGGETLDPRLLRPGAFTWGVRAVAGLGGDREILSVLRANEEHLLDAYRRAVRGLRRLDAAEVLRRHAEEQERRHAWLSGILEPSAPALAAAGPADLGRSVASD